LSKESATAQKRRDAKRSAQQSAKGNLFQKKHPEWARDRMRKIRAECGRNDGIYAHMVDDARTPINITSSNIILTSDYHIPFHSLSLLQQVFDVAEEYGVSDVSIAGDFWDCDNYSRFTHLGYSTAFKQEVEAARDVLDMVTCAFKNVYICRGNHEKRWIDLNAGKMDMKMLFSVTEITKGYKVTMDDHMMLHCNGEDWLLCHPRNYRITPLSVVRDLAAKKHCHVVGAHGHQFDKGWDRSGRYQVADGGGLFDIKSLDYARETSCHPVQRAGFYLLQDNVLIGFEPDHTGTVRLKGEVPA